MLKSTINLMEFETSTNPPIVISDEKNNSQEELEEKLLVASLPKHAEIPGFELSLYKGCWHNSKLLLPIIRAERLFEVQDTDVILARKPKCGTTWLKALVYSILHRKHFTNDSNHPLLTKNPHEVVPYLTRFFANENQVPDLTHISYPRVFAIHSPYGALSKSMKDSRCKMVYIARNPFDTLVSGWHFFCLNEQSKNVSFDAYFDLYCRGMEPGGPYWDHVLGYWKESLERPNKVLFLKYEDLKEDGIAELKKLAKFLGCGFSLEEEKQGVIEGILKLCSLKTLKDLEVNKMEKTDFLNVSIDNKKFFRKGEIGDWVNHLSPPMFEKLDQLMKEKFAGSCVEFKIHPSNN